MLITARVFLTHCYSLNYHHWSVQVWFTVGQVSINPPSLVENAQDTVQAVMLHDVDVEVGGGVEDGEEVGQLCNTG